MTADPNVLDVDLEEREERGALVRIDGGYQTSVTVLPTTTATAALLDHKPDDEEWCQSGEYPNGIMVPMRGSCLLCRYLADCLLIAPSTAAEAKGTDWGHVVGVVCAACLARTTQEQEAAIHLVERLMFHSTDHDATAAFIGIFFASAWRRAFGSMAAALEAQRVPTR